MRVVGDDPADRVFRVAESSERVEVSGFVPDLAVEYSRAWVTVAPLQTGAGVKFKTIEAILAATPVVTTNVGAEGIAGSDRFWALTDNADEFAEGVVTALLSPETAQAQADSSREWANARYDSETVAENILQIYKVRR